MCECVCVCVCVCRGSVEQKGLSFFPVWGQIGPWDVAASLEGGVPRADPGGPASRQKEATSGGEADALGESQSLKYPTSTSSTTH